MFGRKALTRFLFVLVIKAASSLGGPGLAARPSAGELTQVCLANSSSVYIAVMYTPA